MANKILEQVPQQRFSLHRVGVQRFDFLHMFVREQRAFSLSGPSRRTMERALDLLVEQPQIAKVVTGSVPLEATGDAFERLLAGEGGVKVLVSPGV